MAWTKESVSTSEGWNAESVSVSEGWNLTPSLTTFVSFDDIDEKFNEVTYSFNLEGSIWTMTVI